MSGDVFGNGMLRSRALRLVAAFDHRHVFVDPDPDPAAAFAERRRLFELPRSSWADYDPALISPGGGVYPRTLKSIELSPRGPRRARRAGPARSRRTSWSRRCCGRRSTCCGTAASARTSRRATETQRRRRRPGQRRRARQRRRAALPDGRRGRQPRAHPARAASSTPSAGGLVHTDAIDNSAGVDCSDHEVNIKILLDGVVDAGELTVEAAQRAARVDDRRGRRARARPTTAPRRWRC